MFGKLDPISPLKPYPTYSLDLKKALQKSQISHMRNKNRIDKGKKEITFEEGDVIYIENGNKLNRGKLDQVRIGPFRIKRKLSNSVYEIDVGRKSRCDTRLYHISKIVKLDP